MKKKLILGISLLFLASGCSDMMNTPSRRVEEFLGKYQTMDSEVIADLDNVISDLDDYSDEAKKEYKSLMQKQYQNLSYKIKDEQINGDQATVIAEIEVFDYHTSLEKTKEYIRDHKDEFEEDEDQSRNKKMEDYRMKQLKAVTDKVNYTITFNLEKEDKTWKLKQLSDNDLQKLHGLYENG